MSQVHHASNMLFQLLEPISQMMPIEFARELAAFRASPDTQARIDELADKCNEGQLTDDERAEYDAYVDAIDVISILEAKARAAIARQPNS